MNDDLDGIFDNLEPSDFALTTSCVIEVTHDLMTGDLAFGPFIEDQLHKTRYSFAASDGKINPVCVLDSGTIQRTFTPDDDETLGAFLKRMRREARLLGAKWLYIAQVTKVGTIEVDRDTDLSGVDIGDEKEAHKYQDTLREGLFWYAERREPGEQSIRSGIVEILGYILGARTDANEQPTKVFSQILDA